MIDSHSLGIWGLVRALAEPEIDMKFTLIFDGQLPPSAGKRALYASKVRNILHPQMRDLWDNHVIMRQLRHEALVNNHAMFDLAMQNKPPVLPDFNEPPPPLKDNQVDLCAPVFVREHEFLPIVRKSLYLACQIDITFLRHEEPGHLFENGGDLDNRLKCFFDGLTLPNVEQFTKGEDPVGKPLCCLLEDDRLISDFSVRTGRLLGKTEKNQYDVRVQADVTIKVLRMFDVNRALMGG